MLADVASNNLPFFSNAHIREALVPAVKCQHPRDTNKGHLGDYGPLDDLARAKLERQWPVAVITLTRTTQSVNLNAG